MKVVLETERLLLREFELDDLDAYTALIGDRETMRYYPRPYTRAEALDLIERNRARYLVHGFGVWALEERASGTFLGDCGLAVSLVEGIPEVEVMWHVVRDRWREGIASEAATAARDHALGPIGLRRLVALVRPENVPSAGVARRLGMAVERRVTYAERPHDLWVVRPPDGPAPPEGRPPA